MTPIERAGAALVALLLIGTSAGASSPAFAASTPTAASSSSALAATVPAAPGPLLANATPAASEELICDQVIHHPHTTTHKGAVLVDVAGTAKCKINGVATPMPEIELEVTLSRNGSLEASSGSVLVSELSSARATVTAPCTSGQYSATMSYRIVNPAGFEPPFFEGAVETTSLKIKC